MLYQFLLASNLLPHVRDFRLADGIDHPEIVPVCEPSLTDFGSVVFPPYLAEIRTIAEGRIAFLIQVLACEESPKDLMLFYPAAGGKEMNAAFLCLSARVYIRWYQYILASLIPDTTGSYNLEVLCCAIEQARVALQRRHMRGEEESLDRIQKILQNNCDDDLFLWLQATKDPARSFYKWSKFSLEAEKLLTPICEQEKKFTAQEIEKHPGLSILKENLVQLQKELVLCANNYSSLGYRCLTDLWIEPIKTKKDKYNKVFIFSQANRKQLLQEAGKQYADWSSIALFKKICEKNVQHYSLYTIIKSVMVKWSCCCGKINEEIRLFSQEKQQEAAMLRKKERENAKRTMEAKKEWELQKEQRYTWERTQVVEDEQDERLALLVEYRQAMTAMKQDREEEYLCLPWQAHLTPEERNHFCKKGEEQVPVETVPFDVQQYSKEIFERSNLYQIVRGVLSGQPVSQVDFLNSLKSFGTLINDTGSSECKYDIWSVDGRCHRAFFHARHGQDLRITKDDWRFKSIVITLPHSGRLDGLLAAPRAARLR